MGTAKRRMKQHVLPQVRESVEEGTYVACTFDYEKSLPDGRPGRKAWTDIFRRAIPQFEKRVRIQLEEEAGSEEEEKMAESIASSFAREYGELLDKLEEDPSRDLPGFEAACARGRGGAAGLSCKALCALREACLTKRGLRDAFKHVKRKENLESLLILDQLAAEIDAVPGTARDRMELALKNCFAGNLFDLGAHFSSEKYEKGKTKKGDPLQAFRETREALPERPWKIDCLDEAVLQLSARGKFKKAIVFADNAGSDLICGILVFVRELLKAGTTVVVAANEKPAINDITADELVALFTKLGKGAPRVRDQVLCSHCESGNLRVVSSGSDLPIIDLSELSASVVAEAEDADLIVLQGMGRAIESNLNATFSTAVLKMGVVKHPEVALCLGGKLGEPICKLEPK
ncbi:damage-control phosphatase [Chloropicon primus]|uniref:Damage-control phosphatase ARMT1-like metal-binding domain-containing protein n=1 Tax=Chloropicon primus TaxID=1764295 RepID=A0A5B8MFE6_9CHLO|nr:hypothetical protein A3770_02p17110 [Chloropicon primus]UPQ98401.1 damage-control phosphatase [Chloropicon primus]|eukprot:QDZ19193.1 hypothetical protein A3770_02p17110 [Chloropicon primus]